MPVQIRKTYASTDPKQEHELEFYINAENELFVSLGHPDPNENPYGGWITLDASDVDELIRDLQDVRERMRANAESVRANSA